MTGTFGGALEARGIPAGEGYLESEALSGEIEKGTECPSNQADQHRLQVEDRFRPPRREERRNRSGDASAPRFVSGLQKHFQQHRHLGGAWSWFDR